MGLRDLQSLFVKLLGELIQWIYAQGWELTLADGYRPDGQGHMPDSLHYQRLAQDLNLFVNGAWIQTDSPEWQAIGAYWLTLHPLCRWGGNFTTRDLNHFSMEWQGRA